ncbi:hypothetical protein SFUMM280S_05112 [Streptomyces fumanus]
MHFLAVYVMLPAQLVTAVSVIPQPSIDRADPRSSAETYLAPREGPRRGSRTSGGIP